MELRQAPDQFQPQDPSPQQPPLAPEASDWQPSPPACATMFGVESESENQASELHSGQAEGARRSAKLRRRSKRFSQVRQT
jgi:hypothetical protein